MIYKLKVVHRITRQVHTEEYTRWVDAYNAAAWLEDNGWSVIWL